MEITLIMACRDHMLANTVEVVIVIIHLTQCKALTSIKVILVMTCIDHILLQRNVSMTIIT